MIEQQNIDYCIVINFSSRFADVTAEDFVQNYIINNHVKEVVAGFDFTYGKFGKGNMTVLKKWTTLIRPLLEKQEVKPKKFLLLLFVRLCKKVIAKS